MIPVVSVVGRSGVGKTTFVEKLIAELSKRGYRVAAIKHNRKGFDLDHPGKDTWRMANAGATAVIMASPKQLGLIKAVEEEPSFEALIAYLGDDYDIVIAEGYKQGDSPKIELFRAEVYDEPVCGEGDDLVATVTDVDFENRSPCFDLDDAAGVAGLIEERFIKGAGRGRTG